MSSRLLALTFDVDDGQYLVRLQLAELTGGGQVDLRLRLRHRAPVVVVAAVGEAGHGGLAKQGGYGLIAGRKAGL